MDIKADLVQVLGAAMLQIYQNIDSDKIKEAVDAHGLDHFINICALEAGAGGAAAGLGGFALAAASVPASLINTVVQQFRVTMAVIYAKRGTVKPSFTDFLAIVGMSLGVEIGVSIGSDVTGAIAAGILVELGAAETGALVPIVGAAIVGGANYAFIRAIGSALKRLQMSPA